MPGTHVFASAYAKLDWALSLHERMQSVFAEFALKEHHETGRPYGIRFRVAPKPRGLVVAKFIVERPMPDEMALLAGDLIHNTRVALDHTLARLKEHFGGKPGRGSFPICMTTEDWEERVTRTKGKSPLHGLEETPAYDLIHAEQPLQRDDPERDPLVLVNEFDNADKHRLLHPAFAYPGHDKGLDLIEQLDPKRITRALNGWTAGDPLDDGTTLATFLVSGSGGLESVLRARNDALIGFAIGDPERGRVAFTDMIERVRGIVDTAAVLVDSTG